MAQAGPHSWQWTRSWVIEEENIGVSRTGGSSKNENKVKITYSDRELMLRLPVPLLQARGTPTPPDDWPEGDTLGSAWRLEAICTGVS